MKITFFGAVRTVTGSMHLLEANGTRILLECGLFQGRRKEAFERNRNLPFDPASIDLCILSHAHIDHSGNLPTLARRGFRGPIFCTPATRDLCEVMLEDSARLQERDVYIVNKKRLKQGKNPFEPLYKVEDVRRVMQQFRTLPYEQSLDLPSPRGGRIQLTFHDAGHILGSAFVTLDIVENGRSSRLFFTGDMGRKNIPILRDPTPVRGATHVITESTYGNRLHPPRAEMETKLSAVINDVCARNGKLIVPAFAVGRTQTLIFHLNECHSRGCLAEIPIYVDSPLSNRATEVFRRHPECYDAEIVAFLLRGERPFSFEQLHYVTSVEDSKKLNDRPGPFMVIAASGMCEGGRVLHHLAHTVEDPRNLILITGFQAQHTLGRKLVERQPEVNILGECYALRAEVRSMLGLSAHADRNELLDYFRAADGEVSHCFVIHGEGDACEAMAEGLRELGWKNVHIPEEGQSVTC